MVAVTNAWQLLFKGGPMMWPILALSIMALAIGISRIVALGAFERQLMRDRPLLSESLRRGRLKETLRLCEENGGVLAGILKSGILKFGASRDLLKGAMDETLDEELVRIKSYMGMLAVIVNAAPLLGLLGTVNGMTVIFHAVQFRSNVLSPLTAGELASGIWQALLTTTAGLMVGILGFAVYSLCSVRINAIVAYLERSVLEMTNVLQQLSEQRREGIEPYDG